MTVTAPDTLSNPKVYQTKPTTPGLLSRFIKQYQELQSYKKGALIVLDGQSLTVAGVTAAARYGASVALDQSPETRERMAKSRDVLVGKVQANKSVYGVSTGLGGSVLPLSDPLASTSMPEAWVRGAILVRINSLIRGHSAVRWELLEKMVSLLREDITPCVPLRGSVSASGDLTPLAYVAGTVAGIRNIRVFDGPRVSGAREIVSCRKALEDHHIEPLPLLEKETLGIMNGTAFSASVASLALHDAAHLALLAQVCTAMGTEALLGVRGNYDPFIHEIARPHPGQVEAARTIWDLLKGSKLAGGHEKDVFIHEDQGELRQDRYTLRTAPQFLGPQIEDIISALNAVTIECNSTTDNPLFNGETGEVHHGGNFQAMAVTNAMEKTRLALHHIGKLLFAQATELMNPTMNGGCPRRSRQGLDIAVAAYTSELGFLANPVSTHIQSAEMHNQAVNSLALISARATITSTEVLSMLVATYLYLLCQGNTLMDLFGHLAKFMVVALDLRAMQAEFQNEFHKIVQTELLANFGSYVSSAEEGPSLKQILGVMLATLDSTTTMDATDRMIRVAASSDSLIVKHFMQAKGPGVIALSGLPCFNNNIAKRATALLTDLRDAYLTGARGTAPARLHLTKTRPVYEFVRMTLGIGMHGLENHRIFPDGMDLEDSTIGEKVSLIHERVFVDKIFVSKAIRDGQLQRIIAGLFDE
ncbi:phenylalanine ammonia-lyase [Russula aff. rugulosa BPL654]|nr:phenylalanine ammonia-lyase [Russula aff. rugulosa BPL654]